MVIIDSTNLTRAARKRWLDLAHYIGVFVEVIEVEQPIDVAAYRKVVEEDNFPWSVITKQMFEYQSFRTEECDGLEFAYNRISNVVDKQKETTNLSTD